MAGAHGVESPLTFGLDHPLNDADPRVQVYGLKRLVHWEGSLPGSAWESTAQALIQNDRTRFECLLALARHELPPSSQAALLWRGMLEESSNQRWIEFAALNAATRAMGPLMEGALKDGGGALQGLQDPGALFLRVGGSGRSHFDWKSGIHSLHHVSIF